MQGVRVHVWGPRALFARPEMKVERVSYDVITPSAARGILDAIHWKPAIVWRVLRLTVLKPIRFESLRRNEVGGVVSARNVASAMRVGSTEGLALFVDEDRQQRAATLLRDVGYVIEARLDLTDRGCAAPEENVGKHLDMFRRRARKGQCFTRPCLGTREFAADFELVEGEAPPVDASLVDGRARDLGWMAHDNHYPGQQARFFRATMRDGVIDVPPLDAPGVVR